jgi:hypothetical protein
MKTSLQIVVGLLLAHAVAASLRAQDPLPLKTGSDFRKELDNHIDILWKDKRPLRPALAKLSEARNVAIVLDRRVDPDQTVEFAVNDVSLEQALRQLASRQKLGIALVDGTVYLGPESATARLGTIAAIQHDKLQQVSSRKAKLTLPALETEPLSSPRELLEAWAASTGVQLYNADRIPHDLWPAMRYPAQSSATRACLILAGFDLAIEFSPDGSAARVIPMIEKPVLTRSYDGGGNPKNRAAEFTKMFPRADVKMDGSKIVVAGSYEDHDYIARLLRGEKIRRTEVGPGEKRYTLEVTNKQVGAVAAALGQQTGIEVEFDAAVKDKLDTLVTFKVKDVNLEELFKAMLGPAKLDFLMVEGKIRIIPGK